MEKTNKLTKQIASSAMTETMEDKKPSMILKSLWMVLTIFSIMSLLLVGCSTAPIKDKPVTPADTQPLTTKPMETTEVKVDVKDQNSEVQTTDNNIQMAIADGTYDDIVEYATPAGHENVDIVVTVENDIVTAASVTGINPGKKSKFFQDGFSTAMPDLVIGKKISEITLPHTVGGSSLTSAAFQQHLKDLVAAHPAG